MVVGGGGGLRTGKCTVNDHEVREDPGPAWLCGPGVQDAVKSVWPREASGPSEGPRCHTGLSVAGSQEPGWGDSVWGMVCSEMCFESLGSSVEDE